MRNNHQSLPEDDGLSQLSPSTIQSIELKAWRSSSSSTSVASDPVSEHSLVHFQSTDSLMATEAEAKAASFYTSSCSSSTQPPPSDLSQTNSRQQLKPAAVAATATPAQAKRSGGLSGVRRGFIFAGLYFTIFLSGLDQTVTSTILTRIADDFKSLDRIEWVPTIFMLCSTCLNIISGRIADIFGRLPVLMFSLAAFIVGAVLSATSQSIVIFIVARGISGIACGGMLSLSIIVISDIVPLERRGRYLGFLQICFGISNAAGPLLGGMFADRISWRAAFYADMIMGALTTVYLAIVLRLPRPESAPTWGEGIRSLDYLGVTIIIASVSLIIVGMNMGGTLLSWSSPATIICLVVGCVLLGVFVVVELRIPRVPLVPMWIFTVRNLIISCVVTFLCGMCMFSIIFYMPVYFSAVFGANAMRAGLLVLPFGVALSVSSFVSGYFMSALGKYQLFLRLGPAIMAVGVLVLALLSGKTSQISYAMLLLIPGVGMGNIIVANVIAAQATTDPRFIATVTPLCEFFLSIGGVIGVAVFGAVHRNRLAKILTASALGEPQSAQVIINEARKDVSVVYMSPSISDPLRMKIADAYASSMTTALWVLLPFLIVAFILSLVLEKSPTKAAPKEAPVPPRSESTEHML